jgi:precorrin-4 methylase
MAPRLARLAALTALVGALAVAPRGAAAAPGRFYIVGMGTAPDLITVRGLAAIKRADIFILEEEPERQLWQEHLGKKEVWIAPHRLRLFMGLDPQTIKDPAHRALALENAAGRKAIVEKIRRAVESGKVVAALQSGDAMMYGTLFYLETLPPGFPSEIVPGIGALQAATAAVQRSPSFGWDTNAVVLTLADWPGRADPNEKLIALGTSMVFYTMHLDYPALFARLAQHYPADTPVAVVSYAGDLARQQVIRSTVGRFLRDVHFAELPAEMHLLLVGKFLTAGQARKDGLAGSVRWIKQQHGGPHHHPQ